MAEKIYDVPAEWKKRAYLDDAKYKEMYAASLKDPNAFWAEQAKRIDWMKQFSKVKNTSFAKPVSIKWFEDGTTNAAYNCIDRHLHSRGNQTAIIWEGDDPKESKKITYRELRDEVCRSAGFRRIRSPAASRTASPTSSSQPMKVCAAAARCRSRPTPTPRSPRPAALTTAATSSTGRRPTRSAQRPAGTSTAAKTIV